MTRLKDYLVFAGGCALAIPVFAFMLLVALPFEVYGRLKK